MEEEKFEGKKENEMVITRLLDAPPELVFMEWTQAERIKKWWGPNGYKIPYCTVDLRVGGQFRYLMRSPEGQDFWGKGVYREIREPERLVYFDSFSDSEGNTVPAETYGMSPGWPEEILTTVTFEKRDGKTLLTIRSDTGNASAQDLGYAEQGWNESLDRLAGELARELAA